MSAKSPTARSSESTAIAEGIQQHLAQDEAVVAPKAADVDSFSEKDVVWFLAIEKARPEAKIEKEAFITPTSKRRLEWKALAALDSLRLERAFRSWIAGKPEGSSRVTINGDLYQVDIPKRIAYPLYWMAPPQRVIRATWLFDLDEPLPCGEAVASEIEYHYQQGAWRKMSPPTRISLTGNLSVMFFSETEIRFYPDDVTTQLALLLKNEKMSGIPIRRAPAKPFQPSNEFIPFERFSHLVFVIHGIGQKIEEFDIINDANYLRMTVNNLLLQNCGDELYQNGIQILPVQWRKDLDLPCDSTEVEQVSLSEVTLNTLQFFRNALNATFVDVLLYMTPNHRDRIHTNVINRINHLYATFISRHPDFVKEGGKVSVVGHSLGSVITFDLLCHQFETSYVPSPDVDASQTRAQPEPDDSPAVAALKRQLLELEKKIVAEKTLRRGGSHCFDFEVSSFFMLGSPLGVFLTLREDTIHPDIHQPGQSNVFPKCEQLYNIFHPFDPVAYRVEPLVQRSMAQSKPAYVLSSKGGKKFHIELQEKKEELVQKSEEIKKMMLMQFSSFKSSFFGAPSPAPEPEKRKEALEDFPPLKGSSKSVLNTLGDGRIDYVVQDDFFENALIGAVVSHLSYWRNEDVAMFMLKKLYDTSLFVQKK